MLVAGCCQQEPEGAEKDFGKYHMSRSRVHFRTWKTTDLPCRKMSRPMDDIMKAPRVVDMFVPGSSSLVYIALSDVERWMSGARSALPSNIVMFEALRVNRESKVIN